MQPPQPRLRDPEALFADVRSAADALGFVATGAAPAWPVPGGDALDAWLAEGRHADMTWMADTRAVRLDPRLLLSGCRTVVVVALPYGPGAPRPAPDARRDRACVSAYAATADYHLVMMPRLRRLADALVAQGPPGTAAACFVDAGPVLEKPWAAAAGLGWIGRNTCLIVPGQGSWVFLGVVLTTADVVPPTARVVADRCGSCRACVTACPTGALASDGRLDPRLCIAYWTVEADRAWPDPPGVRPFGHLFGCDLCQTVCPWNGGPTRPPDPAFVPRPGLVWPRLDDLERLGTRAWKRLIRGTPLWRRGPRRLRWTLDALRRDRAVGAATDF